MIPVDEELGTSQRPEPRVGTLESDIRRLAEAGKEANERGDFLIAAVYAVALTNVRALGRIERALRPERCRFKYGSIFCTKSAGHSHCCSFCSLPGTIGTTHDLCHYFEPAKP